MKKNQSKNRSLYDAEWTEEIIYDNPNKCDHWFEFRGNMARCVSCGLGLFGVYEIEDGKPVV